jgi:hypothetical protein
MKLTNLSSLALMTILSIASIQHVYAKGGGTYEGRVASYSMKKGTLVVEGKTYHIDREAVIHQAGHSLSRGVSVGQRVNFKLDQGAKSGSRISELWVLTE